MKKTLGAVAVAAAVALSLSACSGSSSSSAEASKGEISYWLWDANQLPAYQQCADDFTKANPDIKVKITQRGWDDYWSTLTNGFVGGTAPTCSPTTWDVTANWQRTSSCWPSTTPSKRTTST
jgi:multiple sugar transport system substrate-binding protein